MKLIDTNIAKCKNWNEFFKLTSSLKKNSTEQGNYFERFTQLFLQTSPINRTQFKNIWWNKKNELPESVRQELNMPRGDEGIDLIAETREGEYCSIQAKFRTDTDRAFTSSDLDRFIKNSFRISKNISFALFLNTSKKPIKKVEQLGDDVKEIGLQDFLDIDKAQWKNIINICNGNKLEAPKQRTPNPKHQKKAIDDSYDHFVKKKNKRGKLIMPCGTGKTLTAFWIAEKLKSKTIIVSVPSIALVKQTLKDWAIEFTSKKIVPKWIAVCSDESVGEMKKMDSIVASIYESGIPTTTDPKIIERFIKNDSNTQKIIFTTYHSSPLLAEIIKKLNIKIDLLIADEAHKTAGEKAKDFSTLLYDKNIKIKKRLFMTATERVCKDKSDDIVSMDDVEVYGKTYHRLSFKEAIKKKLICDYKIITINIPEEEIEKFQEKLNLNTKGGNLQYNSLNRNFLSHIALEKSFKKHNIKHAISFHQSISKAENFKDLQNNFSGKVYPEINIGAFHVSSKNNASERQNILSDFIKEKHSLITNARCLTEGVDIPAIDCVVFSDPKQSTVDIVQACGRAMRNHKYKKFGYIILPINIPKDKSLEEFNKSQEFKTVRKIITALSTQDERIAEYFKKSEKKQKSDGDIVTFDSIDTIDFNYETLKENFYIKTWQAVGRANWLPFDEAKKKVQKQSLKNRKEYLEYAKSEFGLTQTPYRVYRNDGWKNWGDWLGTNFIHTRDREYLPFEEARAIIRSLNLKNQNEWRSYSINKRPDNIPGQPDKVYKNDGWESWSDWYGSGFIPLSQRNYLSFDEAKKKIQSLNLKNQYDYRNYHKLNEKVEKNKKLLPSNPQQHYKNQGWNGWGDFLGTFNIANQNKKFISFTEAKKIAHKLNLSNVREWEEFAKKTEFKKLNIPANPSYVYKKEWINWPDFLGRNYVANQNREYLSYEEAKKIVHTFNIKSKKEWDEFCKAGKKPKNIPADFYNQYRGKGLISSGDFLGTNFISNAKRKFLTYEEAKKFVHKLQFIMIKELDEYFRKGNRPADIPYDYKTYYKKDWVSYKDFLGPQAVGNKKDYMNYNDAIKIVHKLNLKSRLDYKDFCHSGKKPEKLPNSPEKVYKENGWTSWYDWLGTTK